MFFSSCLFTWCKNRALDCSPLSVASPLRSRASDPPPHSARHPRSPTRRHRCPRLYRHRRWIGWPRSVGRCLRTTTTTALLSALVALIMTLTRRQIRLLLLRRQQRRRRRTSGDSIGRRPSCCRALSARFARRTPIATPSHRYVRVHICAKHSCFIIVASNLMT